MTFDPNAAAQPGSGIFGLPHSVDEARVAVLPVPFDATTSYRKGAALGPAAIVEASRQVDLFDVETGKPYEQGIALVEHPRAVAQALAKWNREAGALAQPVIDAGGASTPKLRKALEKVDAICEQLNGFVYDNTARLIGQGKLVATVGGDHATPYGAIRAHAEAYPAMGVLHLDAHADLRNAFEGFAWSHASVMFNVLRDLPIKRLVQVGIRDFCEQEFEVITESAGKVITHFDTHLAAARLHGVTFQQLCTYIIRDLPSDVYVSFDIDALDPTLCPHTGTPVPGGLSFNEANTLLGAIVDSGRRIVGFDLNEVSPGPDDEWDANVGARMLYKLIGWSLLSQAQGKPEGKARAKKKRSR